MKVSVPFPSPSRHWNRDVGMRYLVSRTTRVHAHDRPARQAVTRLPETATWLAIRRETTSLTCLDEDER